MNVIPRGLMFRCIGMVLGTIPLVVGIHIVDAPGDLAGLAVVVYMVGVGIGVADYGAKHPDEFPDDSERR